MKYQALIKTKIKLIIFLFYILNIQSQNHFNSNDYKVFKSDLISSKYSKDSLANSIVIYEFGKSYIDDKKFNLKFEFKQKLKILNKKGFNKANVIIHLYNNESKKETIKNIIATTYNIENGKTTSTKLEKNQIFREKYNDNHTLVKFSMPNIKIGSVITYSYKITSPFIYKYKSWRFQNDIPKLYSEYQTSIPANYDYNIKLVGDLKLDKNEQNIKEDCVSGGNGTSADCTETTYVMKNIPAFVDEKYMTTRDNYLSRIEYELKTVENFYGIKDNITKTWDTTDKELKVASSIGKQMKKSNLVKGLINNHITIENDQLKKSKSIFEFVQKNYTWNKKYDIFKNVSIKNLIKNKSGNVSEINFLLYNLLIEQNINVKPVLLSTRNNGLPTKIYPVISDFNYIIIKTIINDKVYFLDATDKHLNFGQIPFRCLNQYGRLLDFNKGSEWVKIKAKEISTKQYYINLNIAADSQKIYGNVKYITSGYHALAIKKSYHANPNNHLEYFKEKTPEIEITNYKVNNEPNISFSFEELFDIKQSTQLIGDNIYINPFLFVFFKTNPFKLQERTYPIDFGYRDSYFYSLKFNVDKKFEILDYPKKTIYKLPKNRGDVILKTLIENNTIKIYFKFNFKDAIYDSSYYNSLKEYMETVVDIQNNSIIVLKKRN